MREYTVRKILHTLLTLFAIVTILFFIFRMLPVDTTDQVISEALDEAAQLRLETAFGLDKPLYVQYCLYLKNIVTFEWGLSFSSSEKVFDILQYRFWNTIYLMVTGMCLTFVVGIGFGIIMACRKNSHMDLGGIISALVMQSTPPFITGILFLIILRYRFEFFPTGGMHSPGVLPEKGVAIFFSWDFLHHLILPAVSVSLCYLSTPMLIMRDAMIDVMDKDYIELAKAKGLAPHVVLVKHAARNALLSVVAVSSIMFGFAIGGQMTVEHAFSWPGLGHLLVQSAKSHDYPVLQATFLVLAVLVIFLNLVSDISYSYLNPRIKIEGDS